MKLFHLIGIMLLATSSSVQAQSRTAAQKEVNPVLSPQEVFGRVSPSVFVVEALNSKGEVLAFGSGVAVKIPTKTAQLGANTTSGLVVVTNKHVIYGAVAYQ